MGTYIGACRLLFPKNLNASFMEEEGFEPRCFLLLIHPLSLVVGDHLSGCEKLVQR